MPNPEKKCSSLGAHLEELLKDYPKLKLWLTHFLTSPSQINYSNEERLSWQNKTKKIVSIVLEESANNQKSLTILKADSTNHPFWKIANALEFQASLHPILKDVYLFVAGQIRNYLVQEHLKMVLEDVSTRRKWQVI